MFSDFLFFKLGIKLAKSFKGTAKINRTIFLITQLAGQTNVSKISDLEKNNEQIFKTL